jgi:hypothetical protein
MLTQTSKAALRLCALLAFGCSGVSAFALSPQASAVTTQSGSAQANTVPAGATPVLSQEEVIRGIDAAVDHRSRMVSSYTVQELYSIYRNNEAKPSVEVTVNTVYTRATGKDYTTVAVTGSSLLRSAVVDKVIANEKEMAKASNRESVAITSANYEMTLLPGVVLQNGHTCVRIKLKARRKIPYLFNGMAWFDATDFTLVHIEGGPAASPSFFAGTTNGVRDYSKVDGFSMAQHAELHSHSFLFGDTVMKIDYSNYQIQTESALATAPNQTKPAR